MNINGEVLQDDREFPLGKDSIPFTLYKRARMCKGAGMKHMNFAEVKAVDAGEGAKGVKVRWLITDEDGARNFAMRVFDVEPDGYTPFHEHDWEHEMFVLKGGGRIKTEEKEERFERGEFFFIPPGFKHQFINDKKETLRFLCLIPYK